MSAVAPAAGVAGLHVGGGLGATALAAAIGAAFRLPPAAAGAGLFMGGVLGAAALAAAIGEIFRLPPLAAGARCGLSLATPRVTW